MLDQNKKDKTEPNRVVLAYGEATGHAHAFYEPEKVEFDGKEIKVKGISSLKHEEHSPMTFEPGLGLVTLQKQYVMGEVKKVLD